MSDLPPANAKSYPWFRSAKSRHANTSQPDENGLYFFHRAVALCLHLRDRNWNQLVGETLSQN